MGGAAFRAGGTAGGTQWPEAVAAAIRHMVEPSFPGGKPDMFICGDDEGAKKTVAELCTELGWAGAVDVGGIVASRYLEPMGMVWISYYFKTGSGNHAFALLRK